MKKRIVALLLVLVLAVAMMVPVFAAAVEPRACNHNYTPYSYGGIYCKDLGASHAYGRDVLEICTLCASTRQSFEQTSDSTNHSYPPGVYECNLCGHKK